MRTIDTTGFTKDELLTAIEFTLGSDAGVRTDYSGRGMFGTTCFGITLADGDLPKLGIALMVAERDATGEHDIDELRDQIEPLLDCIRLDDMGRDVIAYFPGWNLTGVEEEQNDGE